MALSFPYFLPFTISLHVKLTTPLVLFPLASPVDTGGSGLLCKSCTTPNSLYFVGGYTQKCFHWISASRLSSTPHFLSHLTFPCPNTVRCLTTSPSLSSYFSIHISFAFLWFCFYLILFSSTSLFVSASYLPFPPYQKDDAVIVLLPHSNKH